MTVLGSLKKRAPLLAAGLASFVVVLLVMRWSSGDALFQPSADLGVVIGFALVTLYFVMNDTRGRHSARAPELN